MSGEKLADVGKVKENDARINLTFFLRNEFGIERKFTAMDVWEDLKNMRSADDSTDGRIIFMRALNDIKPSGARGAEVVKNTPALAAFYRKLSEFIIGKSEYQAVGKSAPSDTKKEDSAAQKVIDCLIRDHYRGHEYLSSPSVLWHMLGSYTIFNNGTYTAATPILSAQDQLRYVAFQRDINKPSNSEPMKNFIGALKSFIKAKDKQQDFYQNYCQQHRLEASTISKTPPLPSISPLLRLDSPYGFFPTQLQSPSPNLPEDNGNGGQVKRHRMSGGNVSSMTF